MMMQILLGCPVARNRYVWDPANPLLVSSIGSQKSARLTSEPRGSADSAKLNLAKRDTHANNI